MALGYDQQLFILAFDHRGSSHLRTLFGVTGEPGPQDRARITDAKSMIFDGFARALSEGAPLDRAGMLVDEEFGAEAAHKAKANGWICAMPVERSGLAAFELEHGDDFGAHIEEFDPDFAKVLVRYNVEGRAADNERSRANLLRLSGWLEETGRRLLCELIVPAEPAQLKSLGGDTHRYDLELRPGLMRRGIAELQDTGIEPDVWKLEGIDRREDCELVAEQARAGGRDRVGCVVLGRGADAGRVEHWLRTCAGVDGYLGFAIGRTLWRDQLQGYLAGSLSRTDAARRIAANYCRAIAVYSGAA